MWGVVLKALLVLVVILLLGAYAKAEVTCTRDYGGRIVLGECWYLKDGSYYKLSDLSSFTWSGGWDGGFLLNATDINEPFSIQIKTYFRINNNIYTPQDLHDYYPNYDFKTIIQTGDNHKFGLNINKVPEVIQNNIQYVIFQLDETDGITWDDVEILVEGRIRLKDLVLDYNDLLEEGYTLNLYNKTTLLIGNVSGRETLFLDPIIELNGTIDGTGIIADYHMWEEHVNTNYNYGGIQIGMNSPTGSAKRGMFGLKMPSGSGIINNVTLTLNCFYSTGYYSWWEKNYRLYELNNSKKFNETQATWNKNDTSTFWDNAGGDITGLEIDLATRGTTSCSNEDVKWVIMGDGATNSKTLDWDDEFWFMIKSDKESDGGSLWSVDYFSGRDYYGDNNKPAKINIDYTEGTTTTTTTLPPYFTSFSTNATDVTEGDLVELTGGIQNGTYSLDVWWLFANTTQVNISSAVNGSNILLWDTTTYLGNYSMTAWVNDTENNLNVTTTIIWVNVNSTTTETCILPTTGQPWIIHRDELCTFTGLDVTVTSITLDNVGWVNIENSNITFTSVNDEVNISWLPPFKWVYEI